MKNKIAFGSISSLLASIILLAAATSLSADETAAGCGIGKQIMQGKSGKSNNIVAAILNDALIPKTFFMTTGDGTLGCDPSETVKNEQPRETFVAANLDGLSEDIAKGQGDHLSALAQVMGIEDEDKPSFYSLTQSHYETLFDQDSTSAKQMLSALDNALLRTPNLAKYVQ